jgi:hypothetical protein
LKAWVWYFFGRQSRVFSTHFYLSLIDNLFGKSLLTTFETCTSAERFFFNLIELTRSSWKMKYYESFTSYFCFEVKVKYTSHIKCYEKILQISFTMCMSICMVVFRFLINVVFYQTCFNSFSLPLLSADDETHHTQSFVEQIDDELGERKLVRFRTRRELRMFGGCENHHNCFSIYHLPCLEFVYLMCLKLCLFFCSNLCLLRAP